MKWDVLRPRMYFKSILNGERQFSSSERTMQMNSHTKDSNNNKIERKTNEKREADIGIECIQ